MSSGGKRRKLSSDKTPRRRADSKSSEAASRQSSVHVLALSREYKRQVRPYIDIIDSLRSSGVDQDVSLPAVVVIGDQSTGKSSVLEAISGVQLPRGQGMVTRCALELRMRSTGTNTGWNGTLRYRVRRSSPVEIILRKPGEVGDAVRKAQDALAGDGRNISKKGLIELEVASPDVPDLTLIDLPGIIVNPTEDQSKDIPKQIENLIEKYAKRQETIMLCVIPCSQDIAANNALAIAGRQDPERERTLGVLTRADVTGKGDEGTIVNLVLQNGMKMKLGYTLVKCRSQDDIDRKVTLQEALDIETDFFQSHKHFSKLPEGITGIPNLARTLTKQLVAHIQSCLPDLCDAIKNQLFQTTTELSQLSDPVPEDKHEYLIRLLSNYGTDLTAVTEGHALACSMVSEEEEMAGDDSTLNSCMLFKNARKTFQTYQTTVRDLSPSLNDLKMIGHLIENYRGPELAGFENYRVFEMIARRTVAKFKAPAMQCLKEVEKIVEEVFLELGRTHLGRFAGLHQVVVERMNDLFKEHVKEAEMTIATLMQSKEIIYTSDTTFEDHLQDETEVAEDNSSSKRPTGSTPRAWSARQMLRKLQAYFKIVTCRLCDNVSMAVMRSLFKNFTKNIGSKLIAHIQSGNSLSDDVDDDDHENSTTPISPDALLQEDGNVTRRRELLLQRQERLEEAEKKLKTFCGRKRRRSTLQ